MKTIFTLLTSLTLLTAKTVSAATYNVTTSETWTAAGIPNSCIGCTINISAGQTLTLSVSETCMNCAFAGGTIQLNTGVIFSIKYSGGETATTFTATNLVANGTANIQQDAPINLTNSTWTFNNSSFIKVDYAVNMKASTMIFNGNSYLEDDAPTNEPFSLYNTSRVVVGDGTSASAAYFKMNGAVLNIYDNSYITMMGQSNYYFNWSSYNYYPTYGGATHTSHSTTSTINCNPSPATHTYANTCSGSNTYGPATVSSTTTSSAVLALVLVTFSAENGSNNSIDLAWSTQMESNTSHFTIERSADGVHWNEIGVVDAKNISINVSYYSFNDANPYAGVNYYRVQMVNLDGSFGYTDVKVIRTNIVNTVSFFPNPTRDFVNVTLANSENETTLRLYNQAGQLLQEKKVSNSNGTIVTFSLQQYTPGVYVLNVMNADGTRQNGKILIAR